MNVYSLNLEDHPKASWALHTVQKLSSERPKPAEIPSIFYKFFPAADVEVRMKPQYHKACCQLCGRFDANQMFELGFTEPVTIRFTGDYGYTKDRIFVINDRFLKALVRAKVSGYETKPLGKSSWHALRATLQVDSIDGVINDSLPLCTECQRPKESFGVFKYRRELSLPDQTNTFFTTKKMWPSSFGCDRELFFTEDILEVLQAAGISGGYCTRLWSDEEKAQQAAKEKAGIPFWRPPKTIAALNGKPTKAPRKK